MAKDLWLPCCGKLCNGLWSPPNDLSENQMPCNTSFGHPSLLINNIIKKLCQTFHGKAPFCRGHWIATRHFSGGEYNLNVKPRTILIFFPRQIKLILICVKYKKFTVGSFISSHIFIPKKFTLNSNKWLIHTAIFMW